MTIDMLKLYEDYINEIKDKLGESPQTEYIVSDIKLDNFSLSYYERTPRRFGIKQIERTLYISKEASADILKGIIARESMIPFLPRSVEDLEEKYDLALEFGRQKVDNEDAWLQMWRENTEPLVIGDLYYDAPNQIPALTKASKNHFLWDFLLELHNFYRYGFKLTREDFLAIYTECRARIVPKLNENEIKVLDNITSLEITDRKQLSKKLKLSVSRTSGIISGLKQKQVIYQTVTVDLAKIGFTSYYVYYSGSRDEGNLLLEKIYKNSKYRYTLHYFAEGEFAFLATFLAPRSGVFANRFFEKLTTLRKKVKGNLLFFQRHPDYAYSFHKYNFSKYDVKKKQWVIDWLIWYLSAKRAISKMDILPVYNILRKQAQFNLKSLTKFDIRIIEYILVNKSLNRRRMRDKLNTNMNKLNERIRILEDCGIIKSQVFMGNLGLSEYVTLIVNSEDIKFLNILKMILDELPYNAFDVVTGAFDSSEEGYYYEPNGAIVFVGVPFGNSSLLKRYLREILSDQKVIIHTPLLPKRGVWALPIEDWNDAKKEWRISEI